MNSWGGLNRRKFPRVNYPCLVTIRGDGAQKDSILTHTENIGTGGVCVIIKKSMKMFSPVDVELDLMDFEEHIKCQGRVVWSIRRKNDEAIKPSYYDVGVEFLDLSEHMLERVEKAIDQLTKNGARIVS